MFIPCGGGDGPRTDIAEGADEFREGESEVFAVAVIEAEEGPAWVWRGRVGEGDGERVGKGEIRTHTQC